MRLMTCALLIGAVVAADDSKSEAVKTETKLLEHTWIVDSIERDPPEKTPGEGNGIRCVIKDGKALAYLPGQKQPAGTLVLQLDPTANPKSLDLRPEREKDTIAAIYELTEDTLRVCIAPLGKPRPKEISAKAGSGHSVVVLKRKKE